ncbi:hypothetical protein BCR42DRAFT_420386 [Absidia repens]|uniref:Uncharacterized protein n=1 Tax=Absidia repens TaxID=90262 RepID=A0A1X2I9L1_9FUNG|nr:hypothetical protein BCR42DRAFT_420386 [Absidia repens]
MWIDTFLYTFLLDSHSPHLSSIDNNYKPPFYFWLFDIVHRNLPFSKTYSLGIPPLYFSFRSGFLMLYSLSYFFF